MKKLAMVLGSIFAVNIGLSGAAGAASWDPQAFQAVYDETSSSGSAIRSYAYDGKGHGRSEVTRNGRTNISILDMPNHKMTILMGDSHTVMTVPLHDEDLHIVSSELPANITDKKDLGSRIIDGHTCQGRSYKLGTISTELWTGSDIGGCRVLSRTTSPYGLTVAHLKSYLPCAPAASAFVIPTGYTVMPSFGSLGGKSTAN